MNKGSTVRTCLAQMDVRPGRPAENTAAILAHIAQARADKVDLLVFPEMAVPGYLIGDEWEKEAFLRECEACGREIRAAAAGLVVIFGNVGLDWKKRNEDGRVRKYNALFAAEDRRFVGPRGSPYDFVVKALMPNYREFDDSRHFYDLRKLAMELDKPVTALAAPVRMRRLTLGCILCEDAWDADYAFSPLDSLAGTRADLFVNISCSPFTVNKNRKRNRVYSEKAARLKRPLAYVNAVGIQNNGKTVFTFDGASCIYDGHGHAVTSQARFEEKFITADIPLGGSPFGKPLVSAEDTIADICRALDYGTRKFMELCGVSKVTVGISGGVDSAVVAALYSRIVPPQNLLLVNMPSVFNSRTTRSLAHDLASHLGVFYAEIPIDKSVGHTAAQIHKLLIRSVPGHWQQTLELSGLMRENIQARDRSSRILAAVSAAFGGVFTCNANKSEATVGYTTLYGDLCGYLANIADLWKGEVYELARHLNESVFRREIIPEGSLKVTPSAELSTDQDVDQGKGDPLVYPYHDLLFKSWVESWNRTTPEEVLSWYAAGTLEKKLGYPGKVKALFPTPKAFVADLERWWGQYQGMGLAKRIQAPPVLAVKKRAFGFDHRESQMGARYTRRYQDLKKRLLKI